MILLNKKIIPFLIVILFLTGTINSYAQGPWSLKKGSGFVQLQAIPSTFKYDKILMGANDAQAINRKTWNADYGFYGQYSLTDKLQVIGFLPFKHVSTSTQTDSLYFSNLLPEGSLVGFGNVKLAFKYGIIDQNLKLAVSLQSSWNTASTDLEKGLSTGIQGNSIGLFTHIGGGITSKSYAFIDAGFNKFTNDFSDVIEARLEYGIKIFQPLFLIVGFDVRHSLRNGSYFNENLAQTGLYVNNQEWAVFNVKLNYETKNGIGFNIGLPVLPIKLNNIGSTGAFAFGVYKKWEKE